MSRFRHRVVCHPGIRGSGFYGRRVIVPAARLDVVSQSAASSAPPARLSLELGTTNAYLGQRISARVLMPASPSNTIESLSTPGERRWIFWWTWARRVNHQRKGNINGRLVSVFMYKTAVTPLVTGDLLSPAQALRQATNSAARSPFKAGGHPRAEFPNICCSIRIRSSSCRPLPRPGNCLIHRKIGKLACGPPALSRTRFVSVTW